MYTDLCRRCIAEGKYVCYRSAHIAVPIVLIDDSTHCYSAFSNKCWAKTQLAYYGHDMYIGKRRENKCTPGHSFLIK